MPSFAPYQPLAALTSIEVEALRAEVAEGQAQLLLLQEKVEELDAQKGEASTAIAEARRILHIQKNSTRAEVFKLARACPFAFLRGELLTLQMLQRSLKRWKICICSGRRK